MFKRFLKDKSGSSLVLVMICMSFLILLAGAVITTTVTNIYLKASQKVTQENFYETDSILDAVAAGIRMSRLRLPQRHMRKHWESIMPH